MNNLPDLVRESLTDLTDTAALPPGLGERAMVAGKWRRRRHATLVGAAAVVAVAAAALPIAVLTTGEPPAPAATGAANALFAVRHTEYLAQSDAESDVHRWEVLDPATGDYRDVFAKLVSEPTTDLRFAAVLPKGDGAQTPRRVGRYETTTGSIRWYDIPVRPEFAAISPDGRYAVARGWDGVAQAADIAVVDLGTGQARRFNTAHLYERTEPNVIEPPAGSGGPETSKPSLPGAAMYNILDDRMPEVAWAPDSRHLLFGSAITDLDGRRTGRLALPDDTTLISVHRAGAGTLVRSGFAATDYAVVDDDTGTVRYGKAAGDWTCKETTVVDGGRCGNSWARFLSWRGRDQILIQTAPDPNTQAHPPTEAKYEALDLRTGKRDAVFPPHFDGDGSDGNIAHSFVVVISAEGLSPSVRDRVAF